jgi:hypothetical protein
MSLTELIQTAQFLVDVAGNKKAVVLGYEHWEELLDLLMDLEDADEIRRLREGKEDTLSWEEAKVELRSEGIDV